MAGLLNPESLGKCVCVFFSMILVVYLGRELFHPVAIYIFLKFSFGRGLKLPKIEKTQSRSGAPLS